LNKTLLLSDKAEIDSKPELEILADDVKCSHGATAGELDESGLFYMRSRGIPEAEARQLLMTAFIVQTLNKIDNDAVRAIIEPLVADWMTA
jgi:Fe-S cluster assembly protein SufD